jgi:oligosaccharide repeat unit polymerase
MTIGNQVCGALALICLLVVVKCTTARTFRFSPALLFFLLFILQQVLGCMFLLREDLPGNTRARLGLELGMVGFTVGVVTTSVWLRFSPGKELQALRSRITLSETGLREKVVIMVIGYALAVSLVSVYFLRAGGIPLFEGIGVLVTGDEARTAHLLLKQRRMELTYFEDSSYRGQGYVDQLRMIVLPYVVACLFLWARETKHRRKQIAACLLALPPIVFLMGTGQRHPILAFLLSLTALGYVMTPPALHRKVLGGFFAIGFGVFFALTFVLGRYTHTDSMASDMSMVALGLWNRICYSNAFGTMAVFDLFPNPEPFRHGWTWLSDLRGFLPGPYVAFSAWLFRRLYGFVGTAAPMSFAEMYANFGLPGVLFGSAIVGIVMQTAHVVWARKKSYRAEDLVIYAMGSMGLARLAMGGLLGPIQYGLVGLPLLYVSVRLGQWTLHALGRSQPVREQPPAASGRLSPRVPTRLSPAGG